MAKTAYTYDITTSKKDNRATVCLSVCHLIYAVINMFLSTFLVAHIYSLTTDIFSYAVNVGIYQISTYAVMLVSYYVLSILVDKTDRIWCYRIANILNAGIVIVTIFFGQDLAKLVVVAGVLNGFSHGAYYASFNVLKQEMVSRKTMDKFTVVLSVLTKVVNVVFPIVLGALIEVSTFSVVAIYVLVLAVAQCILTFFVKAKRPANSNFSLKEYFKDLKEHPKVFKKMKALYIIGFFYGLTSAVSMLLNINIMMQFGSNLSLGVITGCCSLFAVVVILIVSKFTKVGKRPLLFVASAILPCAGAILFVSLPNMVTLIVYHVCLSFCEVINATIYDTYRNKNLKEAGMYKDIAEHQCITESIFQITRIISFGLMIMFGYIGNNIVLQIGFVLFVVGYSITSLLLMRYESRGVKDEKQEEQAQAEENIKVNEGEKKE